MEPVSFIDPFAAAEPSSGSRPKNLRPLPAPPKKPTKKPMARPSRGRDREVQQLIHDLAVLAATSQLSPKYLGH
jgi:hypothetical protein